MQETQMSHAQQRLFMPLVSAIASLMVGCGPEVKIIVYEDALETPPAALGTAQTTGPGNGVVGTPAPATEQASSSETQRELPTDLVDEELEHAPLVESPAAVIGSTPLAFGNGLCIAQSGENTLIVEPCGSQYASQNFLIKQYTDNSVQIINPVSGLCLSSSALAANFNDVVLDKCQAGSVDQRFQLSKRDEGAYSISNLKGDRCLTVRHSAMVSRVSTRTCEENPHDFIYGIGLADLPHLTSIYKPKFSQSTTTAGHALTVMYIFDAKPTRQSMRVFVHFVDPTGRIIHTDDHDPMTSTTAWNGPVSYARTVTLPQDLAAGRYKVIMGLEHPTTAQRIALGAMSGVVRFSDLRYEVGEIEVVQR